MVRRFGKRQNRRYAGIGSFEPTAPVSPGPGFERSCDCTPETGPIGQRCDPENPKEFGAELVFYRGNGNLEAVRAFVHVVDRRAAVERIRATPRTEQAGRMQP